LPGTTTRFTFEEKAPLIRIAIIEDDEDVRTGMADMLAASPGMEVLQAYGRAEDFLREAAKLSPDVALMDIGLPGLSGIDCLKQLKPILPQLQVLMWTAFEDDEKIFDALRAGANGYVLKNIPLPQLVQAITDIHAGGSPMSSSIARKVIQTFHSSTVRREDFNLSKRESEILDLLAKGYRYKEIADQLFINIETVRKHIRNTYEKLQVQSRTEALNKIFGTR
jgi:DNA-binding NarL/FixJ family response regulator